MVEIKINYQFAENKPVSKKGGWYDIPLPYDLYYEAGDIVKIAFDLRVEMPRGYEAIIAPRSSTLEKTGLISSGIGVIEDSYCGPADFIGYRFYATKDGLVSAGSSLVQMRFQKKMEGYKLKLVNNEYFENNKNRGGFGSTDNIKEVEPEPEDHYAKGYSDGFEECFNEAYEYGFSSGYDKATEDIEFDLKKEYDRGFRAGIRQCIDRCEQYLATAQKEIKSNG